MSAEDYRNEFERNADLVMNEAVSNGLKHLQQEQTAHMLMASGAIILAISLIMAHEERLNLAALAPYSGFWGAGLIFVGWNLRDRTESE